MKHLYLLVLAVSMFIMTGCANHLSRPSMPANDSPLEDRIQEGIDRLTVGIEGLERRIAALRTSSTGSSRYHELEALDVSAWQLRREQWVLQRARLQRAKELLQAAHQTTADGPMAEQWTAYEEEFARRLEALRQQRDDIERQRLKVEGRLIELNLH